MYGGLTQKQLLQLPTKELERLAQQLQQLQQLQEQQLLQQQKYKKRKRFTPEEDEMLRQLVDEYGTNNWKTIAAQMPNINERQCRERFTYCLSPEVKQTLWTKEEDIMLLQKQSEFGNKWTQIAKFFPGRTDMNIKNRYKQLQQRRSKIPSTNPLEATNDTKQSTDFNLFENLFGADEGFDLAFGQDLFDINLSGADSEFSNLLQGQNSDRGVFGF